MSMKKALLTILLVGLMATSAFARGDGSYITSNIYQRSVNVGGVGVVITLPLDSIDVWIHNSPYTSRKKLQVTSH